MKRHSGFTLIELGIVVTIMIVVTAMAVPSMTVLIKDNRLTTVANRFVTAMTLARSEAVKRSGDMTVTVSNTTWEGGWEIQTSDGSLLRQFEAIPAGMTLTSANTLTSFKYVSTGTVDNGDTLTLCDDRTGEIGRIITVSATGKVRVNNAAVADC